MAGSAIGGDAPGVNALDLSRNAVVGGVGSVLGGGKFANGAVTGAFGYLYNNCLHVGPCTSADKAYVRGEAIACVNSGQFGGCTAIVDRDAFDAGLTNFDPNRVLGGFVPLDSFAFDAATGTDAIIALRSIGADLRAFAGSLKDAFSPSGFIFGRSRLGGSSLLNINANDLLRVGWGWRGSATAGENVFRISGDWVENMGVKSGHIDIRSSKTVGFLEALAEIVAGTRLC